MTLNKTADTAAIHAAERHPLDAILRPRSVAVIGASETEHSVGRAIMRNLTDPSFAGMVYPVNPKRNQVMGRRAYSSVTEIDAAVDLAVIAAPAVAVPGIIDECADAGVSGAIIISAGFKETGAAGAALEGQILANARRTGMRIIGPNCLGVMNPHGRPERDVRRVHGVAGKRCVPQPIRRTVHGDPRLELPRTDRLQRVRVGWLDARRRLGRSDRLSRRRPAHEEHRHLHGIDRRRRARVPLGRARSGDDEADHRDQSRPHRSGGAGRPLRTPVR